MNKAKRFTQSKCDRCGRATKARQNGIGDLYVLPTEWADIGDEGNFCQPCIARYDYEDWLTWFAKYRADAR